MSGDAHAAPREARLSGSLACAWTKITATHARPGGVPGASNARNKAPSTYDAMLPPQPRQNTTLPPPWPKSLLVLLSPNRLFQPPLRVVPSPDMPLLNRPCR